MTASVSPFVPAADRPPLHRVLGAVALVGSPMLLVQYVWWRVAGAAAPGREAMGVVFGPATALSFGALALALLTTPARDGRTNAARMG